MIKKISQTKIRGFDPLIGHAYSDERDIPLQDNEEYKNGLIYIGNQINPKMRIAILGGSTSDLSYDGSWIRAFFKLLNDENILLISGAVSGYSTSQELLKLIRDIIPSKPDIVLSLNGINDIGFIHCASPKHPLLHNYQIKLGNFLVSKYGFPKKKSHFSNKYSQENTLTGLNKNFNLGNLILGYENSIEAFESWYRNIKMSKSLCDGFNIKYLSFLQPTFGVGEYKSNEIENEVFQDYLNEAKLYNESLHNFYENAIKIVEENSSYMYNLINIFKDFSNVYKDVRHPNEKGNIIIAEEILKILKEKKYTL